LNLGTCFNNPWRAYATDINGNIGNWSGFWQAQVDKTIPTNSISYPTLTVNPTFTVTLTEADDCSGIKQGDVDGRRKIPGGGWSSWLHYGDTIDDFNYNCAGDLYIYTFRYRVSDNANNWSNFVQGPDMLCDFNDLPTAINLNTLPSNACDNPPYYLFNFTYTDPDGNTESRFDFQVDNNSNFLSPEVDRTFTNLSYPSPTNQTQTISLSTAPIPDYLNYNTAYYWRVKVYDSYGAASIDWIYGSSITTFMHKAPSPDFSFIPTNPVPFETVQFSDSSRCWDEDPINGAGCAAGLGDIFLWDFDVDGNGNANPETSINENPLTAYSSPGLYNAKIQVTDSDGFVCSATKQIRVSYPLPHYREIRPW